MRFVALLVVALLCGTGSALFGRGPKSETTFLPLSDLVAGQWRFDALDADLSPTLQAAITDRLNAADRNVLLTTGERVMNAAVSTLVKQRPVFTLETTAGLHDGVFVGHIAVEQHGWDWFHDVLQRPGVPQLFPELSAPLNVVIECTSLTRCIATVGGTESSSRTDAEADDASNTVSDFEGKLNVFLQRQADTMSRLRIGSSLWTPNRNTTSATAPILDIVFTQVTEEGVMITVAPRAPGDSRRWSKRLVGLRMKTTLDEADSGSWLGSSWKSVAFYGVLMLVIVGGRHGVKWYFRRQGVDVDQFVRNIRGGKRRNAQLNKGGKQFTDEEIRAMMEEDNAKDAWWKQAADERAKKTK